MQFSLTLRKVEEETRGRIVGIGGKETGKELARNCEQIQASLYVGCQTLFQFCFIIWANWVERRVLLSFAQVFLVFS